MTTELVLPFHKKKIKLVFLWTNMGQISMKVLSCTRANKNKTTYYLGIINNFYYLSKIKNTKKVHNQNNLPFGLKITDKMI